MIAPELNLNDLPWGELITDILYLLGKDEDKLRQNKVYYEKLFNSNNPDQNHLTRFYDTLVRDQQRHDFYKEVIYRLETRNFKVVLSAIDHCIQSETMIQGIEPENYQLIIKKQGNNYRTYYSLLSPSESL